MKFCLTTKEISETAYKQVNLLIDDEIAYAHVYKFHLTEAVI